jgi:uncharacterized protein YjbI with pentapeptide repeats
MRRHRRHLLTRSAVTALVVCGVAVPGAAAQQVDLRSPDTRDAAVAAGASFNTSDLRSADARTSSITPSVDLRSADARSASVESARGNVPVVGRATPQRVVVEASSGFDWADFAIGIGAALSLILLGYAAVSLSHRGRTGGSGPSPLAS